MFIIVNDDSNWLCYDALVMLQSYFEEGKWALRNSFVYRKPLSILIKLLNDIPDIALVSGGTMTIFRTFPMFSKS